MLRSDVQAEMTIIRADPACLPDADLWDDLARNAAEPNPFFESWFLRPALAHLEPAKPVWLAMHTHGDQITGLFPLAMRSHYGRMPAAHVGNWAHYQCFMGTPLIRNGWQEAFWHDLLNTLDKVPWAHGFLSVAGLEEGGAVHQALIASATQLHRPASIVHRAERAMLASNLDAAAYLEAYVRPKKRKEWRRLSNRLTELGSVNFTSLTSSDQLSDWCDAFLVLEARGWKGERGAALANVEGTRAFFIEMMRGAWESNRLNFQRLNLDGKPIAMLINFMTPPGSWSFKIAYGEELARFSPGVMIELRNLEVVLADGRTRWMDSCAVEDHPMIDSIWAERRSIVQVSVPLNGAKRLATYHLCRAAEMSFAALKSVRKGKAA